MNHFACKIIYFVVDTPHNYNRFSPLRGVRFHFYQIQFSDEIRRVIIENHEFACYN